MKLELISFKMCPFVQRAVITLNYKNIAFDISYIDLENPPKWFQDISPMGKVPVLKVDDEVLFESAVINEFLDETTEGSLLSKDPVVRAKQRAWIEYASDLNMDLFVLTGASDKISFDNKMAEIQTKMQKIEDLLAGNDYLFEGAFSLAETSYAPFLMRVDLLAQKTEILPQDKFPHIFAWRNRLKALEAVKNSVVPEFAQMFTMMLAKRSSYLASL